MAARTSVPSLQQQEKTRAAIKTSQLINRLQDFALAAKDIEIDTARLKAIEILLRKSLPDLSSTTFDGTMTHEAGDTIAFLMAEINGKTRSK
jgi:hypothetical protein